MLLACHQGNKERNKHRGSPVCAGMADFCHSISRSITEKLLGGWWVEKDLCKESTKRTE
jgi:hypothetical protein